MKIGFIGLGIMGKPMCRNLMKKGHELVVYNRSKGAVEELAAEGAVPAESAADAARQCGLLITMLPNSPDVRAVALGENGIAKGARPGTVLIDMSSIDPTETRDIAAELREAGIRMLDAPVSGGEPKAKDGTLSIMVGGSQELFEQYYDVLLCMGASAVYVGEIGAGNVAKLANQIIVAVNIAAVGEALTMASKAGVDPGLVYEAIRGGLAGSTVLDAKAPMMLARDFQPGFRMELHVKDLMNAMAAAGAADAKTPLSGRVLEMMQELSAAGCAREDHSALIKYFES